MQHFLFLAQFILYIVHMYRWWVGSATCPANHCSEVGLLPDSLMDNILVHIYTVHQSHPYWPTCHFVSSTCTGLFLYWFSICTTNYMKNVWGTHVACRTALTHSKVWQPLKCDYTKKCDQIKTDRCRTKWSCKVALFSTGNMKKTIFILIPFDLL